MIIIRTNYRYIAVIYNMIVHTAQQLQWQKFGQTLHWLTTSLMGELWGIFRDSFKEWYPRYIEGAMYYEGDAIE